METCPDLDQLIQVATDEARIDVAAHARGCPQCQRELAWMRLIPVAIEGGDLDVPEELHQRTLRFIRMLPVEDAGGISVVDSVLIGALTAITVAGALWVTGSGGSAGVSPFLIASIGAGATLSTVDVFLSYAQKLWIGGLLKG